MNEHWRLITFAVHDAATNMAIDEAILEAHLTGLAPPTLRLYDFSPTALSIGYAQKLPQSVVEKTKAQGIDIVRRPTGGRAVLHQNDLTYCFVGSSGIKSDPNDTDSVLSASISQAYRQICSGLIEGFRQLGIPLELGQSIRPERDLHDCFLATTNADLHINGKKMIGSAQLRRKHAVLQHGSILLEQEQSKMFELLNERSQTHNVERHANLFDFLGKKIEISELQNAITSGFSTAFNKIFTPGPLTTDEEKLVLRLLPKYRELEIAKVR
jgi:lipoate-protein ligase A